MNVLIIDHPRQVSTAHYNDVANAPLAASLNCGYAYSVTEKAGHSVQYLDFLSSPAPPEFMAEQSLLKKPDLILIHWVYDWTDCNQQILYIRQLRAQGYSAKIAAFGQFPSFCYHELIEQVHELDLILKGEFEQTLLQIIEHLTKGKCLTGIPGTVDSNTVYYPRNLIADIDSIPMPADLGKTANLSYINIIGSRGCYGNCGFCCIQPFYGQRKWRGRSVFSIIEEIKQRLPNRQNAYVYFCDPNFFGPGRNGQARAIKLAEELKKLNIHFGLEARVNDIHHGTISKLSEAGLESVFLGIESGSQAVLDRMGKQITPAQSEYAIQVLRNHGIRLSVGFIMFEPDSTLDEVSESFEFLKRNRLLDNHDITANVLYHQQIVFKGTPSYSHYLKSGRILHVPNLPYEAQTLYRYSNVAELSHAIGKLTTAYFQNMDMLWRQYGHSELEQFENCHCSSPVPLPDHEINSLLVNAFQEALIAATKNTELSLIIDAGIQRLNSLMVYRK